MQYKILVENQDQHFVASVIGVPGCHAEGLTEEEAIERAAGLLKAQIAQGKLVTIEIRSDGSWIRRSGNPWLDNFGIFKEDPTFDDFLKNIEEYRQEVDAAERAKEESTITLQ